MAKEAELETVKEESEVRQTHTMNLASVVLLHQLWKVDLVVIRNLGEDVDNMLEKVKAWDQGPDVYMRTYDIDVPEGVPAGETPQDDDVEEPAPKDASPSKVAANAQVQEIILAATEGVPPTGESALPAVERETGVAPTPPVEGPPICIHVFFLLFFFVLFWGKTPYVLNICGDFYIGLVRRVVCCNIGRVPAFFSCLSVVSLHIE